MLHLKYSSSTLALPPSPPQRQGWHSRAPWPQQDGEAAEDQWPVALGLPRAQFLIEHAQ